jgi:peptidoglycan hydrolase CwlO-like protein
MSIRKIKDAKDLNNNELIYFKSHAKATYMSDGSTVEDTINEIKTNGGGDIDLSDYETKEDALGKLQEAKSYTDTAIANLVDSAPETLNTLNELAVAIQENEDVVEILNQSIGSKQDTITDLETIRQGAAKGATAL